MLFFRSIRGIIFGLLAIGVAISVISYDLTLSAQQKSGGGLTPPPRPSTSKPSSTSTPVVAENVSPFIVGEQLSFNVSWSTFPTAARLEMEVVERGQFFGQDSFQIRAKVETLGQVRSLFGEIDNQYTSYISANNGVPYRVINSIRQGQKRSEETITFDQSKQQAIFSDERTVTITPGTFDLPSLVYGLRLRSLPQGDKQRFSALYGKEMIELETVVQERERITTQTGIYNTVCVKFYPQKKHSDYRAYIWFTDDLQKLPVLIKAKLSFGEVRAELTSARVTARPSSVIARLNNPIDESGRFPLNANGTNGTNGPHGTGDRPLPFAVGERLNYEISWGNFTSVGRASLEVRQQGMLENKRVFEFYGEATSTGAARALINVNEQLSSYAMVDKLIPLRTETRLREGKRSKQVSATYDWAKNKASLSSGTETTIRPGTLDLISLFYAIRASELKIGSTSNYLFLDANHRLQMVTLKVVKQEAIGGPMGNRNTLQIDILTPAPTQALLAQAWISNDVRKLPLYFVTRTRFGELRFQMISEVNTK